MDISSSNGNNNNDDEETNKARQTRRTLILVGLDLILLAIVFTFL